MHFVNAAAVAGSDHWDEFLNEPADRNFEVHGKISLSRKIFHAPENYFTTFGETKNTASAQIDIRGNVYKNWSVFGRFQGERVWKKYDNDTAFEAKQLFLAGNIGIFDFKFGKIPVFDAMNLSAGGLVIDSEVVGAGMRVPIGIFDVDLACGKIDNDDYDLTRTTTIFDTDSTYLGLQMSGDISNKIATSIGVHNMNNTAKGLLLPNGAEYSPGGKGFFESGKKKNDTVLTAGVDYALNDDWTLGAIYSHGSAKITKQAQQNSRENPDEEHSYTFQITYGHPEFKEAHQTSSWLAYRQVGRTASYNPAYDGVDFGQRGFEVGVRHQLFENCALNLIYFNGHKVSKLAPPAPDQEKPKINQWHFGIEYEF